MSELIDSAKEKLMESAVSAAKASVADSVWWGWPPGCMGIFYQGKRPDSLRRSGESEDNNK